MGIARTIVALLVAVSVAVLPAVGGAGLKPRPMQSAEVSVVEPMHDCCPPAMNPCDKASNDGACMAACASACFTFAGGASAPLVHPLRLTDMLPSSETGAFHSQVASPPFRPPRV